MVDDVCCYPRMGRSVVDPMTTLKPKTHNAIFSGRYPSKQLHDPVHDIFLHVHEPIRNPQLFRDERSSL